MQITITKVIKRSTDKDGKLYISKEGKPYSRASIQCVEYATEWLGGFWSAALVEGAKVEAEVSEREYNGKIYKDFRLPKKEAVLDQKYEKLANDVTGLSLRVAKLEEQMRRLVPAREPLVVDDHAYGDDEIEA